MYLGMLHGLCGQIPASRSCNDEVQMFVLGDLNDFKVCFDETVEIFPRLYLTDRKEILVWFERIRKSMRLCRARWYVLILKVKLV
jgi:hypothetical protein